MEHNYNPVRGAIDVLMAARNLMVEWLRLLATKGNPLTFISALSLLEATRREVAIIPFELPDNDNQVFELRGVKVGQLALKFHVFANRMLIEYERMVEMGVNAPSQSTAFYWKHPPLIDNDVAGDYMAIGRSTPTGYMYVRNMLPIGVEANALDHIDQPVLLCVASGIDGALILQFIDELFNPQLVESDRSW